MSTKVDISQLKDGDKDASLLSTVGTLAELKAVDTSGFVGGEVRSYQGLTYTLKNDIDYTDLLAVDNAGVIIQTTYSATAAWVADISSEGGVHVEWFGDITINDPAFDSSPYFAKAIATCRALGGGDVLFGNDGGLYYANVTIPSRLVSLKSHGGKNSTVLLPFNDASPALTVKADATDIANYGVAFVINVTLDGFTVQRGAVTTNTGALVELWQYRQGDFDIDLRGDGGIGLKVIGLFEDSFNHNFIGGGASGFDVGVDITDGPQADSIEFDNALIQYNKIGMILGRTRTGIEPTTPDQNAGINVFKISGKIIGRFGGGDFISSGNTSYFETTTTASVSGTATVPVASVSGFEVGEPVVIGQGNNLQYGFVSSIGASDIVLDRWVSVTSGDIVLQGRLGLIACHAENIDITDLQLESCDFGVLSQGGRVLKCNTLALSSVVKPWFINGELRRLSIDGLIGGTAGSAPWKLVTCASSSTNKLSITLSDVFLDGSGYYTFNSDPSILLANYFDVRSSTKPVAIFASDPDIGSYQWYQNNTGKQGRYIRGGVTNEVIDKFISAGKDYFREFYEPASGDLVFRELFDVSADRLDMVKPGDAAPFVRYYGGAATGSADQSDAYVQIGGGTWNNKPLRLGGYYLWVDATGDLRIKNGAPTSATDGTVVGTQT